MAMKPKGTAATPSLTHKKGVWSAGLRETALSAPVRFERIRKGEQSAIRQELE
jgi:hypothetical protein